MGSSRASGTTERVAMFDGWKKMWELFIVDDLESYCHHISPHEVFSRRKSHYLRHNLVVNHVLHPDQWSRNDKSNHQENEFRRICRNEMEFGPLRTERCFGTLSLPTGTLFMIHRVRRMHAVLHMPHRRIWIGLGALYFRRGSTCSERKFIRCSYTKCVCMNM